MNRSIRKLTALSLLVAAGILMQIVESFFLFVMVVPGYKVGLANIAGLYALYAWSARDMVIVTVTRIVLASLATGTLFSVSFILSCTGSALAMLAMALAKKSGIFSIYGVSCAGAICHTIGQTIAISLLYQQFFMGLFLPALCALSVVSGLCIAWLAAQLLIRTRAGTGLQKA